MPPGTVFGSGIIDNDLFHPLPVRWIAVRGEVDDWAIYYGPRHYTDRQLEVEGSKLYDKRWIRRVIHITEQAYRRYRF